MNGPNRLLVPIILDLTSFNYNSQVIVICSMNQWKNVILKLTEYIE